MLHFSVRQRLSPAFVKYYEDHPEAFKPLPETWDLSIRRRESPLSAAGLSMVEVGRKVDYRIADRIESRVYYPKSKTSVQQARPVVVWFHGGMDTLNNVEPI